MRKKQKELQPLLAGFKVELSSKATKRGLQTALHDELPVASRSVVEHGQAVRSAGGIGG